MDNKSNWTDVVGFDDEGGEPGEQATAAVLQQTPAPPEIPEINWELVQRPPGRPGPELSHVRFIDPDSHEGIPPADVGARLQTGEKLVTRWAYPSHPQAVLAPVGYPKTKGRMPPAKKEPATPPRPKTPPQTLQAVPLSGPEKATALMAQLLAKRAEIKLRFDQEVAEVDRQIDVTYRELGETLRKA